MQTPTEAQGGRGQVQGWGHTCSWKAVACSGKPASVKYSTTSITVHSTGSDGFSLRPELSEQREPVSHDTLQVLLQTSGQQHPCHKHSNLRAAKGGPISPR